jgi:hypothetical protein
MNIDTLLEKLAVKRPIFHSEADFQHELAWLIHEEYPNAKIRLETPIGDETATKHLDLLVIIGTLKIAIELKYKKTKLQIQVDSETFNLKPDTSLDTCRFDFLKDVSRIEECIENKQAEIGYAIMLTNVDVFWREMAPGQNSEQFFLHEGRKIAKNVPMKWHEKASTGTLAGRVDGLTLSNDYQIHWQDYSFLGEKEQINFKYLALKIN